MPRSAPGETGVLSWVGVFSGRFFTLLCSIALVLWSGLAVVETTHRNRVVFNRLQELKAEANELEVQWGQLLIEQSTFGLESRIEQTALEKLDMELPATADIVLVEYD